MEFIRAELFYLKFPWMTPGSGLGPLFLSSWIGVYGVGLVIIFSSACILQRGRQRTVGVLLMLMLLVSVLWQKGRSFDSASKVTVMAVQSAGLSFPYYAELTKSNHEPVDIIVWPEYALPDDIRRNQKDWGLLRELSTTKQAVIIAGTRKDEDSGAWYNTALTINGDEVLGEHYKNHTVHFFDDGTAGEKAEAVQAPFGKIGTPICFDCDYEDVIRRMVADGAEVILAPTMDAEHWSEKQQLQHAELFRQRAVENRRWVIVSATNGLTQFIDPYGNRMGALPLNEEAVLVGEAGLVKSKTIYTRAGWLLPWVAMVVAFVWMVFIIITNLMKKSQKA